MSHPLRLIVRVLLMSSIVAAPALALGPMDGEVGALWWANEYETEGVSADAGVPGMNAELWWKSVGVRAQVLGDVDEVSSSSDYTALDVMWKAFSPTENNFFAVGLGWQDMGFTAVNSSVANPFFSGDTAGVRVALEGRVGIVGMVYAYGQAAYLPAMDDAASDSLTPDEYNDMDGLEYEVGVSWKPAPFVSVRGGYRENQLDYTRRDLGGAESDESSDSSGFLLGVGFHF